MAKKSTIEIPGLGALAYDAHFDWFRSAPISIPVLSGEMCRIVVEHYADDPNKAELHAAIANFLSIDRSVLTAAEPFVHAYYEDCVAIAKGDGDEHPIIESPSDVWRHVRFGTEPMVQRRRRTVYVSLECNCDWETEHGLQIVFENGLAVTKVGPYDGHMSNADAYADKSLKGVVYRSRRRAPKKPRLV